MFLFLTDDEVRWEDGRKRGWASRAISFLFSRPVVCLSYSLSLSMAWPLTAKLLVLCATVVVSPPCQIFPFSFVGLEWRCRSEIRKFILINFLLMFQTCLIRGKVRFQGSLCSKNCLSAGWTRTFEKMNMTRYAACPSVPKCLDKNMHRYFWKEVFRGWFLCTQDLSSLTLLVLF